MEEIRKVKRVIAKAMPGAPHEVLLVLDANTGQNALTQVKLRTTPSGSRGSSSTKLDGAPGGGVIAPSRTCAGSGGTSPIPLRFIGVGEGLDDLRPFDAEEFVGALLNEPVRAQGVIV
jgi:fused signal recognition particle receptor